MHQAQTDQLSSPKVEILWHGLPDRLLNAAAKREFRGLTVHFLKRLFNKLQVNVRPKPLTEAPLVAALAKHVLKGEATDAVIAQALAARGEVNALGREVAPAVDLELQKVLDAELGDDDDVECQIAELRAAVEQRQAKARALVVAWQPAAMPAVPASSSGSAPSASSSGAAPAPRRFVPMPPSGMTVAQAREYLPPGCSISKDIEREHRWRLRSKLVGREITKSFGSASTLGVNGALVFLLAIAWRAETRNSGTERPFSFEGFDDV